ncbi:hypothetical protein B0A50_00212 [Salinomyces thailandicus]|uniref:Uncharacterized protein n=1 Tax=Salinomyces thailandicus TaxID=706561 RepID=A0A4U0UGV9_9PEZI|nr:hypothetical protein B0A50_00212 [Salinomyces thailandica]
MALTFQALFACEKHHDDPITPETTAQSLLYAFLPATLRRVVPKIPSLRQIASQAASIRGRRPLHSRSASEAIELNDSGPPSYHTSPRDSFASCEDDDSFAGSMSKPASSTSAMPIREEASSGIDWKYALHGQALLSIASQESDSASQNALFSRKLYIDSLQYLISGLPSDLSAEEEMSLKATLPPALAQPCSTTDAELIAQTASEDGSSRKSQPTLEHSALHDLVANITMYTILMASFILPYLQLLLQQAYRYDRKHKLSDKVFAKSLQTADVVAQQALLLASNFYRMHDGKIGMALRDVGLWWVQGITGGVYDGVDEGMQALGFRLVKSNGEVEFCRT